MRVSVILISLLKVNKFIKVIWEPFILYDNIDCVSEFILGITLWINHEVLIYEISIEY